MAIDAYTHSPRVLPLMAIDAICVVLTSHKEMLLLLHTFVAQLYSRFANGPEVHSPLYNFICSGSRRSATKTPHPRYLITYSDTYIFLCSYTVPLKLGGADIHQVIYAWTEFEFLNTFQRESRGTYMRRVP